MPLPDFLPGLGQLFVDPATLPAGPFLAYDHDGNLVSTIYMIPVADLNPDTRFDDLAAPGGNVDHVDVYFNAGHPGVEKPHAHIVLWHVPAATRRGWRSEAHAAPLLGIGGRARRLPPARGRRRGRRDRHGRPRRRRPRLVRPRRHPGRAGTDRPLDQPRARQRHTATAYHPANAAGRGACRRRPSPGTRATCCRRSPSSPSTVPGVYDFFCLPHEHAGMVGRIVVGEPDDGGRAARGPDGDVPEVALGAFPPVEEIMGRGWCGGAEATGGHGRRC